MDDIERELEQLFVQKQKEITRINAEIKELEIKMGGVLVQKQEERYEKRSQEKILRIDDEIRGLEAQIFQLYDQQRQETSRIDNDIDGLEKRLGVNLDPPVRKGLHSLCDRINRYMVNPERQYPISYNTTNLMEIISALSVNPRIGTTSTMVQNNIRAIAEFMRRRIVLDGDAKNEIISYTAADDGVFDIHLSSKSRTTHLRIYSVKTPPRVRGGDMQYTIDIDLTEHQRVNRARGF
jgi:hypothetical protein